MENQIQPSSPPVTSEIQSPVMQTNESTQSVSSFSSHKIKYIVVVGLIVFLLAAIGGGVYFLGVVKQQSPSQKNNDLSTIITVSSLTPISTSVTNPTIISTPTIKRNLVPTLTTQLTPTIIFSPQANWKTYTNNTYGFSFQYPPELTLSEDCSLWATANFLTCLQSPDFSYLMGNSENGESQTATEGFGIFIKQDMTNYQYDISTLQKDYQRNYIDAVVTTIHTIPTLKATWKDNSGKVIWIMIHNKNVYSILLPFKTQEYPFTDQIISTFTFTK